MSPSRLGCSRLQQVPLETQTWAKFHPYRGGSRLRAPRGADAQPSAPRRAVGERSREPQPGREPRGRRQSPEARRAGGGGSVGGRGSRRPSATYPSGAHRGRAGSERVEPVPELEPEPEPEPQPDRSRSGAGRRSFSPCARRLLCRRAAPRHPPAPREGARRQLHPPPPALLLPLLPASIQATWQLGGGDRGCGNTLAPEGL